MEGKERQKGSKKNSCLGRFRWGCPSRSFSLNFETGRRTISTTSIPLHGPREGARKSERGELGGRMGG